MSFKRAFFKNIIVLGGYNYASQITNFLSSIILSRLLLPEEYGYVALITVFTGFIVIFADTGLSYTIIRSDYGITFQKAMVNLAFYISVVLFVIMLLLAYPIAWFYDDQSLIFPTIVLSVVFIVGSLRIVPEAVLLKSLNFNYVGKVRFMANISNIILMIGFALLGFSYWSLIIPFIFYQLIQYLFFQYKVKMRFKFYPFTYTIAAFKKTKSLITNLSGFTFINYWARNSDNMVIGKFYGSHDLGIYDRGYKMLYLAINMISGLFGTVLYPSLKKFKSSGGNINQEYGNILGVISIVSFPFSTILIIIPDFFVKLMWGDAWMQVAEFLPFFGILIIFQTILSTTGNIFILLEQEKMYFRLGVFSAIVMVMAIISGSLYSVKFIIIMYTGSYLLIILPVYIYIGFVKIFGFSWDFVRKFWIPKILIGIPMFVLVLLDHNNLNFIFIILYLVHVLYNERNNLFKLKAYLSGRLSRKIH